MNYECLICQVKSLPQRLDKFKVADKDRDFAVSELVKKIANIDLENSYSPEITRDILARLKDFSWVEDPYQKEKEDSNRYLLNKYPEFQDLMRKSAAPFHTALRLAIAGNIIDFGPTHEFDVDRTIEKVLTSDFSIDHSNQLKTAIGNAKTILYLADNSGEIVLDRLFLETINHPNIWVAFRGKPVLNDVTQKEIVDVGIDKIAKVISNGDDAPSTLLHRVSKEFLSIYNSADLIISKGMGNYEGLMNETDKRLFYLLMIKCQVIGKNIGAEVGDFVVKQNSV